MSFFLMGLCAIVTAVVICLGGWLLWNVVAAFRRDWLMKSIRRRPWPVEKIEEE